MLTVSVAAAHAGGMAETLLLVAPIPLFFLVRFVQRRLRGRRDQEAPGPQ
ncbi:MAG TPA: hypothetical protein VNE62_12415 [Actinomycetota bacterium]|nr:hypothetical protein [Actinomycetota bacterium]